MDTPQNWKRMIAGALLTGGVAVAGLNLATGTANAMHVGPHQWCPGQAIPYSNPPLTWDMNVCHNYHQVSDGHLVEGRLAKHHNFFPLPLSRWLQSV